MDGRLGGSPPGRAGQDVARLAREYAEALIDPDAPTSRSWSILERALKAGVSPERLYVEVVPAALHEVGRWWEHGRISVAHEHVATTIVQDALRELARRLPKVDANRHTAIVAAVEGEGHELGARIMADLLNADGWNALYVGAATPTDALGVIVAERQPDAVLLSATMVDRQDAVAQAVARVRQVARPDTYILIGGQGCAGIAGRPRPLGADAAVLRADDGVRLLREHVESFDRAALLETLTEREHDVLALLSGGLTNQEIADRLSISLPTAKTHVTHVLQKLQLRNRSQAAALAARREVGSSAR